MLQSHYLDRKAVALDGTRDGFGRGLVEAGKEHPNLYVLSADLTESVKVDGFKKAFPERFVQFGVSEQSLAAIGAGMAMNGARTVLASYAAFSPGRNWEQIKTTIALQNAPVVIVGGHTGVTVGEDGATHQMLEDIALMRVLPNMTVLAPCDANEAQKAIRAALKVDGPVYLRITRPKSSLFTTATAPFEIGKAQILKAGSDLAIVGCGPLLYEALQAAAELESEGISVRVVNAASIKPIDEETILEAAKACGAVLTIEEAQVAGGLGSAVAELLAEQHPTPMIRMGVMDRYGESGASSELLEHFKLTAPHIVKNARTLLRRKS